MFCSSCQSCPLWDWRIQIMQSQLPVSVIRQPVTKPVMCLTLDVAYICQTAFVVGLNPQRILSPQFETQFLYILTFFHHIIFICMFFILWILSVSFYLTLLQTIHLHSNAFIFLSVILMHASVFFCFVFFITVFLEYLTLSMFTYTSSNTFCFWDQSMLKHDGWQLTVCPVLWCLCLISLVAFLFTCWCLYSCKQNWLNTTLFSLHSTAFSQWSYSHQLFHNMWHRIRGASVDLADPHFPACCDTLTLNVMFENN